MVSTPCVLDPLLDGLVVQIHGLFNFIIVISQLFIDSILFKIDFRIQGAKFSVWDIGGPLSNTGYLFLLFFEVINGYGSLLIKLLFLLQIQFL